MIFINFIDFFNNLYRIKSSISQEKPEILSENAFDDEIDDSSSESSENENKEETDLIEIADVEKYVSRRLSKMQENQEKDYDVSPKVKRLLGKFFNDPNFSRDSTEEHNKINFFSDVLEKNQGSDSGKIKNLAKKSSFSKKQTQKIGNNKPQPKLLRRKSVKN